MLNYFDVIKAQSGVPVKDIWAQLWGNTMSTEYVITTYEGTLPATLTRTRAGYIQSYKIYGNLEQTGTPTPENPIVPSECGERTENLWENDNFWDTGAVLSGGQLFGKGYSVQPGTYTVSTDVINNTATSVASVFALAAINAPATAYSSNDGVFLNRPRTVTVSEGQKLWVCIRYRDPSAQGYLIWDKQTFADYWVMTSKGSTALPYEPYGYKLPLTSAGQNVDIYLGESQTTRRIKKLAFDGTENWRIDSGRFTTISYDIKTQGLRLTEFYCSSYQVISDGRAYADVPNNAIYTGAGSSSGVYIYIHTDEYTAVTDFKAYLAQQYSNGTPITIWYPLMTPTTGIVNEPLRKIGDYADTIDSTQTSAQIPTSAGSTTISWAGEGLAPSKVELEYEKRR